MEENCAEASFSHAPFSIEHIQEEMRKVVDTEATLLRESGSASITGVYDYAVNDDLESSMHYTGHYMGNYTSNFKFDVPIDRSSTIMSIEKTHFSRLENFHDVLAELYVARDEDSSFLSLEDKMLKYQNLVMLTKDFLRDAEVNMKKRKSHL